MAYREIADSEIDRNSPVTEPLATAWRDNPKGIAQRDTGAPRVKPNSIESLTSGSGTWTVPAGVTRVRYTLVGGGGGGGGSLQAEWGSDGGDTTLNDGSTTYTGEGGGGAEGTNAATPGDGINGDINLTGGDADNNGPGWASLYSPAKGRGGVDNFNGAGAGVAIGTIEVSPGDSLAYNVGAGGAGGTLSSAADGLPGIIVLEY